MKAYVEKLNVSNSDGSDYDDSDSGVSAFEGSDSERGASAFKVSDSDHGIHAFGDVSDTRDLNLRFSAFGLYPLSIADLSCQYQTYGKSQLESLVQGSRNADVTCLVHPMYGLYLV